MVRTTEIAREETRCRHYMGYSFRLAAMIILYAPSHNQDNTYHEDEEEEEEEEDNEKNEDQK